MDADTLMLIELVVHLYLKRLVYFYPSISVEYLKRGVSSANFPEMMHISSQRKKGGDNPMQEKLQKEKKSVTLDCELLLSFLDED